MLRSLDIRDILIIDRLEIGFEPGLTVLTGETGAGKSILLDALGFVLGWRGRADLVRSGAARGEVTAVFQIAPDHPAQAVLAAAGFEPAEDVILRRTNTPDGRKSAFLNDRRVSGDVIRLLSDCLVELHGQHDDRGLLDPKQHRVLLDAAAGNAPLREAVRGAWARLADARKAASDAREALVAAREEESFLRHSVEELDALDPQPGEDAELDARRRSMQAAVRLRGDVERAAAMLEGEQGPDAVTAAAIRWLDAAADTLPEQMAPPLAALDRALAELAEARAGIAASLSALDIDPQELEATEERLFALRALARKHAVLPDDLAGLADTLRARLARIDRGEAHLADLDAAVTAAEAAYDDAAAQLSADREAAAQRLDASMASELAPLKMERAEFRTVVEAAAPGPSGRDAVAFTVATNAGMPAGPLDKIASGGELSRFLLALKVCLTAGGGGTTLIFDEIDRGVGGATAAAVGRRLAALAGGDRGQVLVVTHSPQVAARGDHHWRVEKHERDGATFSGVTHLKAAARVDEIARMLAGDVVTDEARRAAQALLSG